MNYFIEKELPIVTEKDKIEFIFQGNWTTDLYHTTVGLSDYCRYKNLYYTFLVEGIDIFGNGYKFRTIDDVMLHIKDKIKNSIRLNENFIPILKINNINIKLFEQIL